MKFVSSYMYKCVCMYVCMCDDFVMLLRFFSALYGQREEKKNYLSPCSAHLLFLATFFFCFIFFLFFFFFCWLMLLLLPTLILLC